MEPKNTSFQFNESSGAHREKLGEEGRAEQDQMAASHKATQEAHDADHQKNRDQRIADEEKRLMEHAQLRHDMPRPENVPAPALKTAKEIQQEAARNIEKGHLAGRDERDATHAIAKEDHTRETLNLPPAQSSYAARKAAYVARLQRQRQTPEHEQGHEH